MAAVCFGLVTQVVAVCSKNSQQLIYIKHGKAFLFFAVEICSSRLVFLDNIVSTSVHYIAGGDL